MAFEDRYLKATGFVEDDFNPGQSVEIDLRFNPLRVSSYYSSVLLYADEQMQMHSIDTVTFYCDGKEHMFKGKVAEFEYLCGAFLF